MMVVDDYLYWLGEVSLEHSEASEKKEPECECGTWKTFGKKASKSFHSEWCPVRQ